MKSVFLSKLFGISKNRLFRVLILSAFCLFQLCCRKGADPEKAESALPVRMVPVTVREMAEEVKGFGSLSFLKKFEIVSPLEGVLETLNFRAGDRVNKGDLAGVLYNPQVNLAARRAEDTYSQALAALDLAMARLRDNEFYTEARILENEKSRDELIQAERILEEEKRKSQNREAVYEAGGMSDEAIREERFRIASAETEILFMKRDLEIRSVGLREEDLRTAGIPVPLERGDFRKALISLATSAVRAEAAAARANLEAASREMEAARLMENELRIISAGAGIVGARYVETGERIKRDDRILTLMETDSLYAVFPVSEGEAAKLKKGMIAWVSSGGGEIHEGKLDLISPQADNQSFTFLVRVLLSPGLSLKPGMFARVTIPLEAPRKITVIPEAALVVKKENAARVFVVGNNVLSERNVVLGAPLGDHREIKSGLTQGEVVALGNNPAFKEGVYVSAAD
jgi:multidrug efflux pump subunit AcrA (membrane-fusion protein)